MAVDRTMRCLGEVLLLLLLLLSLFTSSSNAFDHGRQVYIVYMGHLPDADAGQSPSESEAGLSAVEAAHHDVLDEVLDDDSTASERIVRSYKRSFNGFAARLTDQEARRLSGMDGIVSVFPSRTRELLTTRSWDFLGLPQTPQEALPLEGEIIVGMLDSGVWPDSPSFSDDGLGPPPSRWKGACYNFTCNNKIIGARAYQLGTEAGVSAVDERGHGSHTASTVAGRVVGNVSFNGVLAAGTARGAVPGARLAVYKVCWRGHCRDEDVLAAFDDSVADGVDVISFSIGGLVPMPYFTDAAAIGSFHAMRRGVVTSAGAGNAARLRGRVCNVAPWMLSVAASSTDRRLIDKIELGNGRTIVGTSINTFPVVQNATLVLPNGSSCDIDEMAGGSYNGTIVVCPPQNSTLPTDSEGPLLAGAAGAVMAGNGLDVAYAVPLPAVQMNQSQLDEIVAYVKSTSNPVGTIAITESAVDPRAPVAASFSSPGPNVITPGILKPDISAPGVDILASWSPMSPPVGEPRDDKRKDLYNIESGTSMSCPHATGAAAYVKSFHRDWSPAMVMSALITTATPMNTSGNAGYTELNYGAGQLNPTKARDPGLVYDASEGDYVALLCAQGYNATQLALVTGSNATSCAAGSGGGGDLNYPTMAAHVAPGKSFNVSFARTVTNVGASGDIYNVEIIGVSGSLGMEVTVAPERMEFSAQNRTASYTVLVSGVAPAADEVVSVAVVWSDGHHVVRSPVVVYTVDVTMPAPDDTSHTIMNPRN